MKNNYKIYSLYLVLTLSSLSCNSQNNVVANSSDSLVLGNNKIYIKSINEIAFNELEKNNCLQYDMSHIKKLHNQLELPLANEKKIILNDNIANTDNVEQVIYKYIGYFKDIKYYILMVQHYETGEYLLIDFNTGDKTKIWGLPELSPDRKHFITASCALEYDVMPNGIQLWEIQENRKLLLKWEYQQRQWNPVKVRWKDNKSIYVLKSVPDFLSQSKREEIQYLKMIIQ